jgi:predicted nucleic-acid-binding Zn-ribbon protein
MSKLQQARIAGRSLHCPICQSNAFYVDKYFVPGNGLMQIFGFSRLAEGLMLICKQCSNIQYFARRSSVDLDDI